MEQAAQEKLIRIRSAMEKFEPESFDRNTTSVEHDNDLESFDRNTTSVEPKKIYFEQDDSRKSTEEKKKEDEDFFEIAQDLGFDPNFNGRGKH